MKCTMSRKDFEVVRSALKAYKEYNVNDTAYKEYNVNDTIVRVFSSSSESEEEPILKYFKNFEKEKVEKEKIGKIVDGRYFVVNDYTYVVDDWIYSKYITFYFNPLGVNFEEGERTIQEVLGFAGLFDNLSVQLRFTGETAGQHLGNYDANYNTHE